MAWLVFLFCLVLLLGLSRPRKASDLVDDTVVGHAYVQGPQERCRSGTLFISSLGGHSSNKGADFGRAPRLILVRPTLVCEIAAAAAARGESPSARRRGWALSFGRGGEGVVSASWEEPSQRPAHPHQHLPMWTRKSFPCLAWPGEGSRGGDASAWSWWGSPPRTATRSPAAGRSEEEWSRTLFPLTSCLLTPGRFFLSSL